MSAIKGFTSLFGAISSEYNGARETLKGLYATLQNLGSGKVGLMTAPVWLSLVSIGNTINAGTSSTKRVLAITGHSLNKDDVIRFTSGPNLGHEVQVVDNSDANAVLLGQELPNTPTASNAYSILRPMTPTLDSNGNVLASTVAASTTVVDFLDSGSMVPTGGNLIPRSSNNPLQVVASLAADVTSVQSVSDVGEFINIYSDALGATLLAHLVLTPDETVDVDIPAGTSVYFGASKDADIDDAGSIISMNFIG